MKNRLILMLLLVTALAAKANPVDMRTAREVAVKFVNANTKTPLRGEEDLQLVTTNRTESNDAAFHVFNTPNGFVIVSADDCATPILGYSDEGRPFDMDNIPIQLQGYLQGFVEQIQYGIENHIEDEAIAQQWELVRSIGRLNNNRDGGVVGPLVTTQWGQTGVYGSMCPNGIVGCVGVAVAQVMNYWQYPPKGIGHIDYNGNEAFFNETIYHWDSLYMIPDALPTLMYHAAIGSWSRFFDGSTGSGLNLAQSGLVSFFDYDSLSYFANKGDYFNYQWIDLIKDNLDNSIPVLYRGDISNGGGHAWVCDGYDENDLFHMNWGWEGFDDGWFLLNALNAGGWSITGGGAVFDLVPMHSPLQARFEYAKNDENKHRISFYDFSKDMPDEYYWDFGDGNISTSINPIHLYDTTGLYTVSLTVSKEGLSDVYSLSIEVKDYLYFEEIKSNIDELIGSGITLDYDMDGLQDLFWMGSGFSLQKNCDSISNMEFSFKKVAEYPECTYSTFAHHVEIVDFDNCNTPSVLCWGQRDLKPQWFYFQNQNESLIRDLSFSPVFFNYDNGFRILDYNNDGLMDVAVGNAIYKNIGNKLFVPIDVEFQHGLYSWIDIDKDGDVDIISSEGIYINDGGWNYQHVSTSNGGIGAIDDFDGDGQLEMISSGMSDWWGEHTSYVYEMGENLSFIVSDSLMRNDEVAFYKTHADINNDGLMDVFEGGEYLFNYNGDTVYCANMDFGLGLHTSVWIDYNSDNSIDIIQGNEIAGDLKTYLYKNIHSDNIPPTVPTNLSVETIENTAFLHWDASTDDHTYSGSLTYNIAVGSAPDSCNILSPLSNLETGKRYAISKGNAGMGTVWRINDLPNGTYYWRVQAIDQAFVGSPFSEMGTFTISGSNLPPAMAPIAKDCYMNKPNTFTREEFLEHYYDRDKDPLQSIIITQLPSQGTLFLDGNAVVEGQSVSSSDLGELYYVTTMLGDDAFMLKPFDGTDYADHETTISFNTTIFEPVWELDNVSGDVAWGDYNNDGQLDFVATWGVYKNENGNFTQILDAVPAAEHVFWADVNNDGLLDAVFSETVLINAGNDSFVWQEALNNQDGELSDMADANNDNKVDYLIIGMDESLAALYFNTGNGFAEDSVYRSIPTFRDGKLEFADYNNDGRIDFVVTGWTDEDGRETSLYRNSGLGFDKIETVLPEWGTGSLDWGDYDNDGDLDLIVCGYNGSEYKTAIYNNNHGTMSLVTTETLPGVIRGQVKWMDYNNDGLLDILLVGYDGNTICYLYKNTGFLSFYQIPTNQIGITPLWFSNVAIADFDGDGYQDVLLSGSDQNREAHTYLVRNSYGAPTSTMNIAPEVPSNLQSEVVGNGVQLAWNKSSDNTTPQTAIAYNVYIRNEENDEFLVSPLSDVQTGFHKVTDRGNCCSNNFMDINSLDAGTYYWSVQSIDNGLMSSAFAPEQSFTVTCNLSVTEIYDTVQCAYYWNGEYYLNSTTATGQFTTSEGCDSTVIIHVQVLQDTCWNPIYVTESGEGLHNGDSWENAMGDLQKAIDLAAMHGSSIWVKQGTYKGDTIQEDAFNVYNGVSLYGGFVGNEPADFDINLRNPMSHPTILDGQNAQRVLCVSDEEVNSWHCLDGFILQNGNASILLGDRSILRNSKIQYCQVETFPQGLVSGGVVVGCVFSNNAYFRSMVYRSVLNNCVFALNDLVPGSGYGMCLNSYFNNCIVYDDSFVGDVFGGSVFNYCAFVQGQSGEGNIVISSDNDGDEIGTNYVRFEDPENGDFRLSCGSVCINTGTPDISGLDLSSVDLNGNPRVMDYRIDMGAYEFDPADHSFNNIIVSVALEEGGSVSGSGEYLCGEICTVTAIANDGYFFLYWMEDDSVVSTESNYSFFVKSSRDLVANFREDGIITFADDIVKNICVEHWDTNGDGELSYGEAAVITTLDYAFWWNNEITSFDELQFFINLSNLVNEFTNCEFLTSIILPNTMVSIGVDAFRGCNSLTFIEIPNSVDYIGGCAFLYCESLAYVIAQGETPPTLGWGAFEGVDHSIPIYVPCGSLSAYQNAEGWNEFTNIIEQCPFHFTTAGTWSTASNWQGGVLPRANAEVFIDAPCQLDQNAEVAALTVSDGQSITLQSGKTLTVTGDLTNTVTTGLIIEDGAQLIHNVANVQATVKKLITPFSGSGDGWHLIALPLMGSIDVESVGNLLEGEYDLYGYNEPTTYWRNSKHPVDGFTALEAGKGYLYANGAEVTLEFSGTLENGSATINLPLSYTEGADFSGFNLVGNPFPCNAYLDREYYVMSADGMGINPVAVSATTPIPPCTAVFVKAVEEGDSVVFTTVEQ